MKQQTEDASMDPVDGPASAYTRALSPVSRAIPGVKMIRDFEFAALINVRELPRPTFTARRNCSDEATLDNKARVLT